ncbi:MAG: hypothetical protein PWR04_1765, partial [Anaerophaga sp.]|nr:hypothetical protein [Anaerophaga sp.]
VEVEVEVEVKVENLPQISQIYTDFLMTSYQFTN